MRRVSCVLQSPFDGLGSDLVEDHALDGDLRLENLEKVPGDGLTFAVLICCEIEFVGVLEEALEFGDLLLLARVDPVVGIEVVVDVDGEFAVRSLLHICRELGRGGKVADVADRRLNVVTLSEVPNDRSRLRRRLDDDETAGLLLGCGHAFTFLSRRRLIE